MHTFFQKIFDRYPVSAYRVLEVIPPLLSVFFITLPFWGAFLFPVQLAYFIIFFDVYWLYKSLNLAMCSFIASRKIKEAESVNWLERAEAQKNFDKMAHIWVLPNYKEKVEKISETLDSLAKQTLPLKKLFIFVAFEEREEEAPGKEKVLQEKFEKIFGGLYFTYHPDFPNEVKGKSSNQAFAATVAHKILIEEKKHPIDFLTVSSVDADSIFDSQYYSYLTFKFLTSASPHLRFWQSANVHYNNFWQIPSFTRINSFFGSLVRTSLLVQGMRLIPNSTYSLSFKLLKSLGYWDTDVIPEDYRIYFKAFFATRGQVAVEPLYIMTSMDAAQSHGYMRSLVNKYEQERRWSWGISDDAMYMKWYLTVKDVPFLKKTYVVSNVLFDHIMWSANWFLVTISANVVVLLNPVFSRTTLGYNLPRMSGFILTICLFTLFILIFIDFNLRPGSASTKKTKQFLFPLEFVLMPIAGFLLSSFPALISHIQLIIGKRLEYKVTEKA